MLWEEKELIIVLENSVDRDEKNDETENMTGIYQPYGNDILSQYNPRTFI